MKDTETGGTDEQLRQRAIKRIEKKRGLQGHVLVYILVNAACVGFWAMTGGGFFWPIFLMILWGIGVVMNVWDVYRSEEADEHRIRREMDRIR